MHFKSKFLILDEPTNYLSVKETNKIISFVKGPKPQGVIGISIGRNIHHVFESCDRIVGMARGKSCSTDCCATPPRTKYTPF
jgi:simple sugar transport system ATP-binding protein